MSPQAILRVAARQDVERSLFGDPEQSYNEAVQFYRHEVPWTNRLILGDSLQVMTSLARREDLAGKVQMIYMDPPYGIKFASNFQPEVGKREVSEKESDLTREPEMVRAFRDTWHLGVHSYLQYLKDRLVVARELLADSGSIFMQMGPDHANRVRCVMDEVFGAENFVSQIAVAKTAGSSMRYIDSLHDYLFWYAKDYNRLKYRPLFSSKAEGRAGLTTYRFVRDDSGNIRPRLEDELPSDPQIAILSVDALTSQTQAKTTLYLAKFRGKEWESGKRQWATPELNLERLIASERVEYRANSIGYVRYYGDFPVIPIRNMWTDTGTGSFTEEKVYVVQTGSKIVERCKRPILILGPDLVAFLKTRRLKNKRPCQPGEVFCVRCRVPRLPAGEMAEYIPITGTMGNLAGICPECDTMIYRRVSLAKLPQIRGKLEVTFLEVQRRVSEPGDATVNSDLSQGEKP